MDRFCANLGEMGHFGANLGEMGHFGANLGEMVISKLTLVKWITLEII